MSQPWVAPSPPPDPATTVIHAFRLGLQQFAIEHPWLLAVVVVCAVVTVGGKLRTLLHTGPRDTSQRLFSRADKQVLLALAGHRCEHHSWPTGRCQATDRLEADHVHPWSRGGWTHIRNGQILCRRHNRVKLATIPYERSLRRLAQRRHGYYPPGADPVITRRPPARPAPQPVRSKA